MIEGFAPLVLGVLSLAFQLWTRSTRRGTDTQANPSAQTDATEQHPSSRTRMSRSGWFLVQSAIAVLMIVGGITVLLTAD